VSDSEVQVAEVVKQLLPQHAATLEGKPGSKLKPEALRLVKESPRWQ
jgi:hypothetical protein